jgi:heme/copper-type cytochrome/quinol oxidase subunit 2
MDLVSIFATIVLVTTIATLVLAVAAYLAYKLREWRKPTKTSSGSANIHDESFEPIFLKRHMLGDVSITSDGRVVN